MAGWSSLFSVWSAYSGVDPSRPVVPDQNRSPGPAPAAGPGVHPVELVVDGERFSSPDESTHLAPDFDWSSHPASYGFGVSANLTGDLTKPT